MSACRGLTSLAPDPRRQRLRRMPSFRRTDRVVELPGNAGARFWVGDGAGGGGEGRSTCTLEGPSTVTPAPTAGSRVPEKPDCSPGGGGCPERVAHGSVAHEVEGQGLAGPRPLGRRLEGEVGRELFPQLANAAIAINTYRHDQLAIRLHFGGGERPGGRRCLPVAGAKDALLVRWKGRRRSLRLLPPVQGFPRSRILILSRWWWVP